MEITITGVWDLGGDVLLVTGTVDGREVEARGWCSALARCYDPSAYQVDGHLGPKAERRARTKEERESYCRGLLAESAGGPPTAGVAVAVDL